MKKVMGRSNDTDRDKDGFEAWVTKKKLKKKTAAPVPVVHTKNVEEKKEMAGNSGVRRHHLLTEKSAVASGNVVAVVNKKSRGVEGSNVPTPGNVVITQDEYQLLLSLKKKVE